MIFFSTEKKRVNLGLDLKFGVFSKTKKKFVTNLELNLKFGVFLDKKVWNRFVSWPKRKSIQESSKG